jgi:hypothetical protein
MNKDFINDLDTHLDANGFPTYSELCETLQRLTLSLGGCPGVDHVELVKAWRLLDRVSKQQNGDAK